MKKLVIIAVFLMIALSSSAVAWTDFKCMNDCIAKGYMYNYCLKLCNY